MIITDPDKVLNEMRREMEEAYYEDYGEGIAEAPMEPTTYGQKLAEPANFNKNLKLWSSPDGRTYYPVSETHKKLPPDVYEFSVHPQQGPLYTRINYSVEDLVRFEDSTIDEVVEEIQSFWEKKKLFEEYKLPFRRGILMYGPAGCHAAGTDILMYDGRLRKVEDVEFGDMLMGPDSTSREVLRLCHGSQTMYRIIPKRGDSFVVNENHILHLVRSGTRDKALPKELNVSVKQFLEMSKPSQNRFKLTRSGPIEFDPYMVGELLVDPYFLGVWLGDGTSRDPIITTADPEIVRYLKKYASSIGQKVSVYDEHKNAQTYRIVSDGPKNELLMKMRALGVINNKHIPNEYMVASVSDRLQLLAGIIDTDGSYASVAWRPTEKYKKKGYKGYFDVIQKNHALALQIQQLARSVGLGTGLSKCTKTIKSTGFSGEYYRISIFGNIKTIPTKLPRKRAIVGKPNKDPLLTGIKKIERLSKRKYYGFCLDKDHLYLTGDYIVHHNSGKSCATKLIIHDVLKMGGIAVKFENPGTFIECMRTFRQLQPDTEVIVIMEDIEATFRRGGRSQILNILDGIDSFEKVAFLATTNYPELLEPRIKNRPSRFDKRFNIGLPKAKARRQFIEFLLSKSDRIKELDIDSWVRNTEDMSFAHIKELFISVNLFGRDYQDTLTTLREMSKNVTSENFGDNGRGAGFHTKKAYMND
jgi:hypothetical protein